MLNSGMGDRTGEKRGKWDYRELTGRPVGGVNLRDFKLGKIG